MYGLPCWASACCKNACAVVDDPSDVGAVVVGDAPYTGNELCVPSNSDDSSDSNDDEPDAVPPVSPVSPVNADKKLFDELESVLSLPVPEPDAIASSNNDANSGDVAAALLALASDELLVVEPVAFAMIWLIS